MATTYADPVDATVKQATPDTTSTFDAISAWGGILFAIGVGLLVGALTRDALAGVGAGLALGGALAFVAGAFLSMREGRH